MQPTKQDAVTFLNQVLDLCKDKDNVTFLSMLEAIGTDSATDTIADWYCEKCDLTMDKFGAIQEVIAIPHAIVHIEQYFRYADEMLQDVLNYDYEDELNDPIYAY